MAEMTIDDLFCSAAENASSGILKELLDHLRSVGELAGGGIPESIDFLLESWDEELTGDKAAFCLELAALNPPDSPFFREKLTEAIKSMLPPYLNKVGFMRSLGLRDHEIAPAEIAARYQSLIKLKNNIIIFLPGSSRWGKVNSLDGISTSVGITSVYGEGAFAVPISTALSEGRLFNPGPDTLKLSGFDKKSGFSSADYRNTALDKALVPFPAEEIREIAFASLVPRTMPPDEFENWWKAEGTTGPATVVGRQACDARSIQEMHVLLSKEAENQTSKINADNAMRYNTFFSRLKPAVAVKESKILAEVISMLVDHGNGELLADVFTPLIDKAPFWPKIPEAAALETLEVWGKIKAADVANLSLATDYIFSDEYLARYAIALPLRCLNTFCEMVDDHLLFEAIRNQANCSCDILLWIWRNRKKHDPELLQLINAENILKSLSNPNLPKAWQTSQRELKKQLLDKKDFQSQIVDSAGDDVSTITAALQNAKCFVASEQQSLLVKLSRLSKNIRALLEEGVGKKLLGDTGQGDAADNQPLITSFKSHKALRNELDEIINVHVPENREALKVARAHGDFRENAEYDAAKERRNFLHRRRAELERDIGQAQPVDFCTVTPEDIVIIGSTVSLKHADGEIETHYLLGAWDGDPDRKWLSYKTKLGETLLYRKAGDKIKLPNGKECIIQAVAKLPDDLAKELSEVD